ncbi:MAG: flagellar biosynthetic protein FliR [Thermaerobacter sp.]|nr:flagellar biosynthetic protein FliR [Thermaerobacter sp.]
MDLGRDLLAILRVGGFFLAAPVFGSGVVPLWVRTALSLVVGMALAPLSHGPVPTALLPYLLAAGKEVLVGLGMGYVVNLLLAGVQYAGGLLDLQMGFGLSQVLNPAMGAPAPVLTNLLYFVALVLFIVSGGLESLLLALGASFRLLPLGAAHLGAGTLPLFIGWGADIFTLGLSLAMPVLAVLLILNLALGILSRAVPQLNVFILGMPLQAAFGLLILLVSLPAMDLALRPVFAGMAGQLLKLVGAVGGSA